MCRVGLRFVSSLNVTLVTLSDKVLMHLVLPRCKVCSIELLGGKSASHLGVHCRTSSTLDASLSTTHVKAMGLDQATTRSDTMKRIKSDSVQRLCVYVRQERMREGGRERALDKKLYVTSNRN